MIERDFDYSAAWHVLIGYLDGAAKNGRKMTLGDVDEALLFAVECGLDAATRRAAA